MYEKELGKLKSELEVFCSRFKIPQNEALLLLKQETLPVSIFSGKLSPLETVVKFLKENRKKRLVEIAKILNKKTSIIWLAYKNSKKKYPIKFQEQSSVYDIPIKYLYSKKITLLERISVYLKDNCNLTYHEIGQLLKRNERTIWTTYKRAKSK